MKKIIKSLFHSLGLEISNLPKKIDPNSIIDFRIDDFILKAPTHKPNYFADYPFYSRQLGRLAKFLSEKIPELIVIDVGANIGDTLAVIKNQCNCEVICIEGDAFYFELLKINSQLFQNITLQQYFLGEKSSKIQAQSTQFEGSASLTWTEEKNEIELSSLDNLFEDELKAKKAKAKLLKVDTDGYDLKILKGAWQFIQTIKPVLFFEYDATILMENEENPFLFFEKLAIEGYKDILFYDNFGKLLLATTLQEIQLLHFLHHYILGKQTKVTYWDVCIFHQTDQALAKEFIEKEMQFFNEFFQ